MCIHAYGQRLTLLCRTLLSREPLKPLLLRFSTVVKALQGFSGEDPTDVPHTADFPRYRHRLRPISPLRLSLLRSLDSNFPVNSLRAWEFHPLK